MQTSFSFNQNLPTSTRVDQSARGIAGAWGIKLKPHTAKEELQHRFNAFDEYRKSADIDLARIFTDEPVEKWDELLAAEKDNLFRALVIRNTHYGTVHNNITGRIRELNESGEAFTWLYDQLDTAAMQKKFTDAAEELGPLTANFDKAVEEKTEAALALKKAGRAIIFLSRVVPTTSIKDTREDPRIIASHLQLAALVAEPTEHYEGLESVHYVKGRPDGDVSLTISNESNTEQMWDEQDKQQQEQLFARVHNSLEDEAGFLVDLAQGNIDGLQFSFAEDYSEISNRLRTFATLGKTYARTVMLEPAEYNKKFSELRTQRREKANQ